MLFDSQQAAQSDEGILTGFDQVPARRIIVFTTIPQELIRHGVAWGVSAVHHFFPNPGCKPLCLSIQNELNLHG